MGPKESRQWILGCGPSLPVKKHLTPPNNGEILMYELTRKYRVRGGGTCQVKMRTKGRGALKPVFSLKEFAELG